MNNSCSMKLRLLWCSSKLVLVFIALVLVNPPRRGYNLISAQIYTSRNECVSYDTVYEIKYRADHFDIQQRINFYTISPVTNCYFYAENFLLRKVFLWQNESSLRISIDEIGNNVIAVKLLYGDWLLPNFNYSIDFTVQKKIEATGEGLVFKVYRNLQTMKMCEEIYSHPAIGIQFIPIRIHLIPIRILLFPGIGTQWSKSVLQPAGRSTYASTVYAALNRSG